MGQTLMNNAKKILHPYYDLIFPVSEVIADKRHTTCGYCGKTVWVLYEFYENHLGCFFNKKRVIPV